VLKEENTIREFVKSVIVELKTDEKFINILRTLWAGGRSPIVAKDIAERWITEVERDRGVSISSKSAEEIYDYAVLRYPGLVRRYKNAGSKDPVKSATQALQTMLDTKFGVLRTDV